MRETEAVQQQLNVTPASCNELRVFVDDLLSAYAFVRLDAVARARVCPAAGKFSVVARAADKPFGADVTHRATYVEHVGRCVVVGIPQPMQFPRGLEKRNEMHERIRSQQTAQVWLGICFHSISGSLDFVHAWYLMLQSLVVSVCAVLGDTHRGLQTTNDLTMQPM
jgi:hypothetical protein